MFAGSSTVALLMSGSVENFPVTKTQPEPRCRRKREAIGPVLQLTHLVKTSTKPEAIEQSVECNNQVLTRQKQKSPARSFPVHYKEQEAEQGEQ